MRKIGEETTSLAKNAKIKPLKCQFIQQLHFSLSMTSPHRTENDRFFALAMFTLLRSLQLTKNISGT